MMRNRRIAGIAALALLVGGVTLYGFWRADRAEASKPRKPSAIPVEVARVRVGTLTEEVSAVGTAEARRDVVVSAEAGGRLVKVCADVGDRVTEGAALVEVDSELRRLAVVQAEAQVAMARANAEKADLDLARNRTLFEKGDVSSTEMEGFRVAAQAAASTLQSAEAALGMARRQLADTRVLSPIGGVVAARLVEAGEMVGPGTPVANIVDLDVMTVRLTVPEVEVGRVAAGQRARVTVDLYPGLVFEGAVSRVGSKSEGDSHRYPVEVEVPNPDGRLKAGMFVRTVIVASVQAQVPLIPSAALMGEGGSRAVFVVRDGRAALRPVTPAGRQGDTTAVAGGLTEGDLVVTVGQQMLKGGALVEVRP